VAYAALPPPEPKRPETFEEAVNFVYRHIDPDTVEDPLFHFTGGMCLRNNLGLWDKESPLHKHMLERFGLCHADDTSSLITSAANARKNNLPYDPEDDARRFKSHWLHMGLDPATMERRPIGLERTTNSE
jgi:hypothetical protein